MSGTLTIDADRCTACGRCEIACAVAHSASRDLFSAIREGEAPRSRITISQHEGTPVPLVCVHCDDPACAAACPAAAIEKRPSGEVVLSEEMCVGCGACAVACYLGVPAARGDGRAYVTCDLCVSRTDQKTTTACAEACPTGAITFVSGEGRRPVEYVKPGRAENIYRALGGRGDS
jgi:carbon-monoxide dehydrogenase iron sulfur subunit